MVQSLRASHIVQSYDIGLKLTASHSITLGPLLLLNLKTTVNMDYSDEGILPSNQPSDEN